MDVNSVPTVIFPENMCRICIEFQENVQNIDDTLISYEDNVLPLLELLNLFSEIELNVNHPTSICLNCITKATEAYQFKIQCDKSTQILHKMQEAIITCDEVSEEQNLEDEENIPEGTNPDEDDKDNNHNQEVRPYACCFCSETFSYEKTFKEHIQTHKSDLFPEEDEHKCTKCGECLPHMWGLRVHLVTCQGGKPHKCWQCGQTFSLKKQLRKHQETQCNVKPYVCELCGKQFTKACFLKQHTMAHNNDRPFGCDICGQKFITNALRRVHVRYRHEGVKRKKSAREALKLFLCAFCGLSFGRNYLLKLHLQSHLKDKKLQCEKCGKIFSRMSELRAHYVVHKEEKLFKCKECGRAFARKYALKKHECIHTGYRPHVCRICNKTFIRVSTLTYHMKIHTREQIICAICGRGFSKNRILEKHIIDKHSDNDISTDTQET